MWLKRQLQKIAVNSNTENEKQSLWVFSLLVAAGG